MTKQTRDQLYELSLTDGFGVIRRQRYPISPITRPAQWATVWAAIPPKRKRGTVVVDGATYWFSRK